MSEWMKTQDELLRGFLAAIWIFGLPICWAGLFIMTRHLLLNHRLSAEEMIGWASAAIIVDIALTLHLSLVKTTNPRIK